MIEKYKYKKKNKNWIFNSYELKLSQDLKFSTARRSSNLLILLQI